MNDAPPRRRFFPAVLRRHPEPEAWQTAAEKRAAEAAAKAEAGDQGTDKAKTKGKQKVKVKLPPVRVAPDSEFERLVLVIFTGAIIVAVFGALAARFPFLHDVAGWWDWWSTWWASHTGFAQQ